MIDELKAEAGSDLVFFEVLAKSAQARFGLAYTPLAQGRLYQAMKTRQEGLNMPAFSDYAAWLRREPGEWNRLWPLALAGGGAFLRPAAQFEVARDLILEWSVMAPERTLRVLSLGCGPGFELVSLAVALEEAGLRAKNWQVDIYGLDLNPEAVEAAEKAVFTAADLDWLTESQRRKWFTPRAGGFVFKKNLAPARHPAAGNAYEPEEWPFKEFIGAFDLIFCRGLTWEAPPRFPRQLARILRQSLAPTGFIFTAPGEFLPDSSGDLHLEERSGVTYYRRGSGRVKLNRPHQSKKQKTGHRSGGRPAPEPEIFLPGPREVQLLGTAEEKLEAGRPEEARELVNEALICALDQNRPAVEAWALAARIEKALGRDESAEAAAEVLANFR